MATVTELKAVLKDTLERRGVLGHLKARIRAEVFSALDDDREPRPSLSHENLLINELIREYLEFNKYKYTASVLMADHILALAFHLTRKMVARMCSTWEARSEESLQVEESGQPVVPLDRQFLIRELNAFEESKDKSIAHFLRGPPDGVQNVLLTESTLHPANKHLSWKSSRRPDDDHVRKDTGPRTTTEEFRAAAQAVSR
ncbi:Centrosomal protein 20 [Apodemus speciosus]|uniref:Centrosomal protein 20 n=1 Tax=Apodemus speciosus TaxID=105296 RepID=A0ABQ0FL94_APOSI